MTLLPVRPPETVAMRAADGARLDADVYRPQAPGSYPVLLMRQPYGRRIASTVVYAHPSWYAAHGYIVAIQDVRGRGSSEGRFRLFADDVGDGGDAVAWAAGLPGANGRVGMYGFSYQGHTQLLALAAGRPELQALCPGMATWDLGSEWAYEGGAFCLANNIYWGVQMGAEQARLAGDAQAFDALRAASLALPLDTPASCRPEVLAHFSRYTHYQDWVDNPPPSPYWDAIAVGKSLEGRPMEAAMLHFGGWWDFMLRGTLNLYRQAKLRSSRPQKLIVGPWTHLPWSRRVGAVDYGSEASGFVDALQIAWFDRFLRDVDNGVDSAPAVRLFDLVARRWRDFDAFPEPEPRAFYTSSNGLAATSSGGRLASTAPDADADDAIVHDPWRPVPTSGGHHGTPGGMQDRAALDQRSDVLTYTTDPLPAPLTLAGEVNLTLAIRSDQPSFDVSAVLSHVAPNGRAFNLTQGHRRVEAPAPATVRVEMRALCATIPAGDGLRLSLAGADFPAFPLNPGDGPPATRARALDNKTITLTVLSGGASPTHLELPVHGSPGI